MSTLALQYVTGIRDVLLAQPHFPARIEVSPVLAAGREDTQVLSVVLGAERVVHSNMPRVTREREVHIQVRTAGDDHLPLCESVLAAAHPIVMAFRAAGIVQIEETQTDEPRYANGDLTRQLVVKRYLITYQTLEDSLTE